MLPVEPITLPIPFQPDKVFDQRKHHVDVTAKTYLELTADDVHDLVPVVVAADGNCLYHSILLLMNNPMVTTSELRGE